MPILRAITTKIKTAISPSSSPSSSPTSSTSSTSSGFEVLSGRREGGCTVKRAETQAREDSFMASRESVVSNKKQKRVSRFREELGVKDD